METSKGTSSLTQNYIRREALRIVTCGLFSALTGCNQTAIPPIAVTTAEDIPVKLEWTVNEISAVDESTVIEVTAGTPLLVFGKMQPKPLARLARAPKAGHVFVGFTPPPLPKPKSRLPPDADKPEDYHVYLVAIAIHSDADPKTQAGAEFGMIDQQVGVDRKNLLFSGGLLCPKRSGKYTLRLWGAFKQEKLFRKNDDRNQCGDLKAIREITLIVTKTAG